MHHKYEYKFDAVSLIDFFGGASATTRILNEMGADISRKAVQKMRERDQMQSDVLATLMAASMKVGQPINPYAYILEKNSESDEASSLEE